MSFKSEKNYLAVKSTLIYFVIGMLWIIFSDLLVFKLFSNSYPINTYKGTFFVVVTSLLFYFLSNRNLEIIEKERVLAELNYRKYKNLFNHIGDNSFVLKITEEGKVKEVLEINDSAKKAFEISEIELLEKINEYIKKDLIPKTKIEELLAKTYVYFELAVFDTIYEINSKLFKVNGENIVISICRDITERKKIQENLENLLKQKQVILNEVHHRVKNNLQVIISLLNLQLNKIEDKKYKLIFEDIKSRIISIALVHRELYSYENLSSINFKEYIFKLTTQLKSIFHNQNEIELEFILEENFIPIEQAIPCGLIINETLTNAFKHAFNKNGTGKILIEYTHKEDLVTINIKDNGCGFNKNIDIENIQSLGIFLVKALAEQLDADLKIVSNDEGTNISFTFKIVENPTLLLS
jgi:two-component sensor histidine kinase